MKVIRLTVEDVIQKLFIIRIRETLHLVEGVINKVAQDDVQENINFTDIVMMVVADIMLIIGVPFVGILNQIIPVI